MKHRHRNDRPSWPVLSAKQGVQPVELGPIRNIRDVHADRNKVVRVGSSRGEDLAQIEEHRSRLVCERLIDELLSARRYGQESRDKDEPVRHDRLQHRVELSLRTRRTRTRVDTQAQT